MEFRSWLYKAVSNPIEDDEIIGKLIRKSFDDYYGIYGVLSRGNTTAFDKFISLFYKKYVFQKDYPLLILCFKKWKNYILNAKKLNHHYLDDAYNIDELKAELNKIPDITTKEEYKKLIKPEIRKIFEKHFGCVYWYHVYSSAIECDQNQDYNVEHRLYLNIPLPFQTYFVDIFMKYCENKKIPYYYKTTKGTQRDDGVVVYTNDEYIVEHIAILKEIKEKYDIPFGKPPILSGSLYDFIGYGSNPKEEDESFNSIRTDVLLKMKEVILNYLKTNPNKIISFNGKNLTLDEYAKKSLASGIEYYCKFYIFHLVSLKILLNILSKDLEFKRFYRDSLLELLIVNGIDEVVCFDEEFVYKMQEEENNKGVQTKVFNI